MKLKSLLLTLGATLAVGLGALAGVTSMDKGTKEVKAAIPARINALLSSNVTSYWYSDSAITCFKGADNYVVQLTRDTELETVTLDVSGVATTFDLWSGTIDLDNVTYNSSGILRMKSDKSETWNGNWGIWKYNLVDVKSDNTFIVNSGSQSDNVTSWGSYFKLKTYSGVADYSDLTQATKSVSFEYKGAAIAQPNAPTGMSFVGWYTDSTLETAFSGSTVTSDLTLYAKYATNTYDITKSIYFDGVLDSSTVEHVEEGNDYTIETPSIVTGYHFVGWFYRNNDGTWGDQLGDKIENISAPHTICARYESRSEIGTDSYIYYVADIKDSDGATPNYIYTYNSTLGDGSEKQFGAWPGTAITSVATDVHGSFGFQGYADYGYTRHVYKIPYSTSFTDNQLIIVYNNGKDSGGDQTASIALTQKSAYWWESTAANVPAGAAIDFLVYAESIRNSVTASGNILNYSVCGITPAQAADLYGKYEKLTDKDVYIDSTYTYTYLGKYDGETVPEQGSVCYYDIMAQLYEIALRDATFASTHSARNIGALSVLGENSNNTLIIIAIAGVSLLAVAGFFLLKRKEER